MHYFFIITITSFVSKKTKRNTRPHRSRVRRLFFLDGSPASFDVGVAHFGLIPIVIIFLPDWQGKSVMAIAVSNMAIAIFNVIAIAIVHLAIAIFW